MTDHPVGSTGERQMATATRKATWRSGPANGWHDDLSGTPRRSTSEAADATTGRVQTTFNQAFPQSFTNARVSKMAIDRRCCGRTR